MDPMIPGGQWNPMTTAMETDMTMTGDDMANQSSGPQTNNQKASERMRLDESECSLIYFTGSLDINSYLQCLEKWLPVHQFCTRTRTTLN